MPRKSSVGRLKRAAGREPPSLYVILACEGTKTERIYFGGFIRDLRAVNIKLHIVQDDHGSDPVSVVSHVIQSMKDDKYIDLGFAIIDRDSHANFDQAISISSGFHISLQARGKREMHVGYSVPSFELWLLLHLVYCNSPFVAAGGKSSGDLACVELERTIGRKYCKSDAELILSFLSRRENAIQNAKRLAAHNDETGSSNPATSVHVIVERLVALARSGGGGL